MCTCVCMCVREEGAWGRAAFREGESAQGKDGFTEETVLLSLVSPHRSHREAIVQSHPFTATCCSRLFPSLKTWHLHPSGLLRPNPSESHSLPLPSSPATRTISRSICNCGFKPPLSPAWVVAALSGLINVFRQHHPTPHQPRPLTVCSQYSSQGGPR